MAKLRYQLQSHRPQNALLASMAIRVERNDLHERLHEQNRVSRSGLRSWRRRTGANGTTRTQRGTRPGSSHR